MNKVVEEAKERSKRILIAEKGNIKAPIFLDDLEVLLKALDNSIPKEKVEKAIEEKNIQAREHKNEKILTIIEREKATLRELLEGK